MKFKVFLNKVQQREKPKAYKRILVHVDEINYAHHLENKETGELEPQYFINQYSYGFLNKQQTIDFIKDENYDVYVWADVSSDIPILDNGCWLLVSYEHRKLWELIMDYLSNTEESENVNPNKDNVRYYPATSHVFLVKGFDENKKYKEEAA